MSWRTHLRLGRVSNLPTVWTNVLAGAMLSGARPGAATLVLLAGSLSLFYIGGMYLNDAFDHRIDRRERPNRPIPAGEISAAAVFRIGGAMLAAGWLLLIPAATGSPAGALAAGGALAAVIVLYNAWHKNNPLSPLLMGTTRALVYLAAALAAAGRLPLAVLGGAALLLAYLIGLTYAAKQETLARIANLWPLALLAVPFVGTAPVALRGALGAVLYLGFAAWVGWSLRLLFRVGPSIGRAVVSLIAGISLLDALLIASAGEGALALAAVFGFAATLAMQRHVPGT